MKWININIQLPKNLEQCLFLLDNGETAIGRCRYFEYGDSELFNVYGKNLYHSTFRNWELHNFDRTQQYKVTHYFPIKSIEL